ncbi:hypothetical protein AO066_08855 [Pseudomonas fluorescens]|nr:hypothetical protein AO066_08855 [Pseudomonas fluorescens]
MSVKHVLIKNLSSKVHSRDVITDFLKRYVDGELVELVMFDIGKGQRIGMATLRSSEISPVNLRPHPYEYEVYFGLELHA